MNRVSIELPDGKIIRFPSELDTWKESGPHFSTVSPAPARPAGEVEWLHRTDSSRFALIGTMVMDGAEKVTRAHYIAKVDGVRWLLLNGKEIPEDLREIASRIRS